MADYLVILDSETNPNAPLRSSLFKRMVANPVAIAEGAPGAPRIAANALAGLFLGAFTSTGTTPVAVPIDANTRILRLDGSTNNGSNNAGQVRFSNDGGATWGSYQSWMAAGITGGVGNVAIMINLDTGAMNTIGSLCVPSGSSANISLSSTLTIPSGVNAMQIRSTLSGTTPFNWLSWCLGGRA